jgi:hypothetical protein
VGVAGWSDSGREAEGVFVRDDRLQSVAIVKRELVNR